MRPYLLKGHERPLTQIKYNREGDLVVSCAKNLQPCLWLADDGTRIGTYEGHNGAIWTCEISHDSSRLITSSADQTVKIWELATGREMNQIKMNVPCRACALSVGEQLLAFTTDSFMGSPPQIHMVDMDLKHNERQGTEPKFTFDAPKGRITRVFFTEFNTKLVTSHDGGFVRKWDVETGKMLQEEQVRWAATRRTGGRGGAPCQRVAWRGMRDAPHAVPCATPALAATPFSAGQALSNKCSSHVMVLAVLRNCCSRNRPDFAPAAPRAPSRPPAPLPLLLPLPTGA